jgi:FkbM family methyltransferase
MTRLRERWRAVQDRRRRRRLMGPRLLEAFADAFPRAFFIEIGANDGVEDDHLRPFIVENEWSGIMVEPVPHLFERLRRNYAGLERVVLENVAIADRDGRVPFYHPPEGDFDKIGSFSRETTLRLARALQFPDLDDRIVTTEVPCLSFESQCRRHHVERLDLLVVDTEGYDFEILKRIDFSAHSTRLLVYEHGLLSSRDRSACRAYVEGHGYATREEELDTWCLDIRADDGLTRAWHGLRPGAPGTSAEELGW